MPHESLNSCAARGRPCAAAVQRRGTGSAGLSPSPTTYRSSALWRVSSDGWRFAARARNVGARDSPLALGTLEFGIRGTGAGGFRPSFASTSRATISRFCAHVPSMYLAQGSCRCVCKAAISRSRLLGAGSQARRLGFRSIKIWRRWRAHCMRILHKISRRNLRTF